MSPVPQSRSCLFSTWPLVFLLVLAVGAIGVFVVYEEVNIDPFGWWSPDFAALQFNPNRTSVTTQSGARWTISYEKTVDSVFSGLVRHVSPIRMADFPFLTHDVLVTSGEYADSKLVNTSVFNHHFTWTSDLTSQPQGGINLLHVVPATRAIYDQLLNLSSGQQVTIRGVEIQRIDAYRTDGSPFSYWQDDGCNSLLVSSVEIKKSP
jgi:hypothetical protein